MGFIGRSFRFLWRALDALRRVLHLLLLLVLFALLFIATRHPLPMVPSRAALVVRPEGRLVEQLTGSSFGRSLGLVTGDHEPETLVRDVVDAIRGAASDARIKVLVLDTSQLGGGGLTKLRAVAAAVADFRKSGKKVLAFGRYAEQEQFYLMAQADEVYLDPAGAIGVVGFAAYGLYFHEALDRLGVQINVFKVGTHKSYTEAFTRQDMSPEDREQTVGWLQPLWQAYQAGVEQARQLPAGTVQAYVTDAAAALRAAGGDAARLAEERKLVTGRKTWLEFEAEIEGLVGEDDSTHSFNAIGHADYLAALHTDSPLSRRPAPTVAVLVAAGNMVEGTAPPGEIGADSFVTLLRSVRHDDDVKAVVLRIDSGGGSLMASEQIRQEVAQLRATGRPVVASFSSVAASGGYYIAMETDQIWAEPTTITGSIGVFGMVPTFAGTLAKVGVASDGVATSPLAGAMHLERNLGPEARDVLQQGVEHAYRDFVARVATARKRSPEEIEKVAQGRVWIGTEARELGLIDQLGGADQAITAAAGLAHLAPGKYGIRWREQELTWRERLVRQLRNDGESVLRTFGLAAAPPAVVGRVLGEAERELRALAGFNDRRHIYVYCGCGSP